MYNRVESFYCYNHKNNEENDAAFDVRFVVAFEKES